MALADRYKGNNFYAEWTPDGGSAVELDADYRSFNLGQSTTKTDATAGADTHRGYLYGPKDGTFQLDVLDDAAGTVWGATAPGTSGALVVGTQGNGSGAGKVTLDCTVESRELAGSYDDLVTLSITFQLDADVTEGTFT